MIRDKRRSLLFPILVALLLVAALAGAGSGAVGISPEALFKMLGHRLGLNSPAGFSERQLAVLEAIRLPRVLLGVLIGACLSISGAAMQGLFRNPLADPSLIGISAGAALSAAVAIVLLSPVLASLSPFSSISALSLITFLGAAGTTLLVFHLSRVRGRTVVYTLLLAGIAINALAGAGTGLLTFAADDDQLRSLTFWTLGSLGGATWTKVGVMLPLAALSILGLCRLYKPLNAFALGEEQAAHLGTATESVKRQVIAFSALSVGASVAFAGMIGFVGLVIPHILRLLVGPDHRIILPASALAGAALLTFADTAARTMLQPAELPIGVLTALVGAPVFLLILVQDHRFQRAAL